MFVCYINTWCVCFLCVLVCLCVHLQCSFLDVWAPRLPLLFPFTGSVSWETLGRCVWYDCPGVLLIITMGTFSISSQWMLCRHPILHAVSGFEHPVPWRQSQNSALWTDSFIIYTYSCSRWRPDQALALGEKPGWEQKGSQRRQCLSHLASLSSFRSCLTRRLRSNSGKKSWPQPSLSLTIPAQATV